MLAPMNRGSYWSGDCFFRAWGNGQAQRSQQRSSGACGSPVRPPLSPPDGLIGEVEAVADGSMVEEAGAAGAGG
jgi:hypothetical protein